MDNAVTGKNRSYQLRGERHSGFTLSEESSVDMRLNFSHLNLASACERSGSNAAYFSWPNSSRMNGAAEDRANYFENLQKRVLLPETHGRKPTGKRATSLIELMTILAFYGLMLRRESISTAIGLRIRKGALTDIPAILVFVARKVHKQWLDHIQCFPSSLEGPGGVWCDVDIVELSFFGAPAQTPKEEVYSELVNGLRGGDPCIGSGSQVASQESFGTLGAIVRSRTGNRGVGFLTNMHVAVDLDYPNQKMFHPVPPSLGPGVYLGAVERATSFVRDDLWYGTFAGTNPETFVQADGAFIAFADSLEISNVTTTVKGVGEIEDAKIIDLQSPINSLIGKQVVKVGRSSGLTTGTIIAYAHEYKDEKGICFFTDFLVVGDNQQTFHLDGDSGSLILLTGEKDEKPRPIGIIWGGTGNHGQMKLKVGQPPENWTSGVDLGRLLNLLQLDLITTSQGLQEAVQEQRSALADSMGGKSAFAEGTLPNKLPLGFNLEQFPTEDRTCLGVNQLLVHNEFNIQDVVETTPANIEEHQFIPNLINVPLHKKQTQDSTPESAPRNGSDEDLSFGLYLGDGETQE
ncbi:hypothetical protein MKW92_011493 [Papaver armeniacum]|nr:hypothetical protein MKW92_011493 [Papaver armeniacum]